MPTAELDVDIASQVSNPVENSLKDYSMPTADVDVDIASQVIYTV